MDKLNDFGILFEDVEIIVVQKPPNMPSQKDFSGDLDLLTAVEQYLRKPYYSDEPFAYLIHRLDRPVGGVMVFAKTEQACERLSKQLVEREMSKSYLAIVCNQPVVSQQTLTDYILKTTNNLSKIVPKGTVLSKKAILSYQLINTISHEEFGILSLLQIELQTGRHHQIRVQLSHAGFPIWGDTKYNTNFSHRAGWYQIALFANKLTFLHPTTQKMMCFEAMPEMEIFECFKK